MRILLLTSEFPPRSAAGGIGFYVATIAPALATLGHEVHVLCCGPFEPRSDETWRGVWVHRRPSWRIRGSHRFVRGNETRLRVDAALTSLVESKRLDVPFDVVEAPEWMAGSLGISLLHRLPVVVNLHSPLSLIADLRGTSDADVRLADRLERAAARRAAIVTAPSRLLASHLRQRSWLGTDPEIIPHPIDATEWASIPSPSRTGPVILAIGRIETAKNPDVLLRAAAQIPGRDHEVVFVGRGSGLIDGQDPEIFIEALARDLGVRCSILGELARHELRLVVERARVIAIASRFETFSMVALETMSAGRPVVCSNTVGAAELIAGTGAGTVVPVADATSLASALTPYIESPAHAEAAGAAGRALVRATCDPVAIAGRREGAYAAAVDRAG